MSPLNLQSMKRISYRRVGGTLKSRHVCPAFLGPRITAFVVSKLSDGIVSGIVAFRSHNILNFAVTMNGRL